MANFVEPGEDRPRDEWDEVTSIQVASVKDVAYLKRDIDELRRALRTVWILCIFALASLVVSLTFLASRSVGISQDDLKEILEDHRSEQITRFLLQLEKNTD